MGGRGASSSQTGGSINESARNVTNILEEYQKLTNGRKIDYENRIVTLKDTTELTMEQYDNRVKELMKMYQEEMDKQRALGYNTQYGDLQKYARGKYREARNYVEKIDKQLQRGGFSSAYKHIVMEEAPGTLRGVKNYILKDIADERESRWTNNTQKKVLTALEKRIKKSL